MDAFYVFLFALLATLCAALEWPARWHGSKMASPDRPAPPSSFFAFRYNYLVVYSLMMGAWPRARRAPRRALKLRLAFSQPVTGCKARTSTPSTPPTASASVT